MPFLNELQLMSSFRFEVLCHNNFKSSSEVGKVAMKTCFQLMCCQNWPAFFYNELLLPPDGLSNNNGRLRLLWGDQVREEELNRIRPSLRKSKNISCFKVVQTCSPKPAAEQWLEWVVVVAVVARQASCARVRCGSDKKGVVATQSSWGFKAVVHVSQVVGGWIGY